MAQPLHFTLEFVVFLAHVHKVHIAIPRAHDRILHETHRLEDDARGFETGIGRDFVKDMGALVPAVHPQIEEQGHGGNQQEVLGGHACSGKDVTRARLAARAGEPIRTGPRVRHGADGGPASLREVRQAENQSMQTSPSSFRSSSARPVPMTTVDRGSSTTVMGREVSSRNN